MGIYKPELQNMSTRMMLLIPEKKKINGKVVKVYPETSDITFLASFKSFGGTEKVVDGVLVIEDTANIFTWYNPQITSDCRVVLLQNHAVYDVLNEPENVDMRNQFMKFKVKRYKGGV